MRKNLIIALLLVGLTFWSSSQTHAQIKDKNAILKYLNSELEKEAGFTPRELKSIEGPLKNMLDKGATKNDLKGVLVDLSKKDIKGDNLKNTVNSMNDLVNSGESPKEAGNIVSHAAHQALAQGLKGKDLAAKVHEAISQRKIERENLKEHKKKTPEEKRNTSMATE